MRPHLWRYDPAAIAVTAVPRLVGPPDPARVAWFAVTAPELGDEAGGLAKAAAGTIRAGARVCAACRVLQDWAAVYDVDEDGRPGPCPGPPPRVRAGAVLPGSDPPDPSGAMTPAPPRWGTGRQREADRWT